ncbi:hypothetical protein BC938DRAFT_480918 [Jimgerdemannia flammicorona]|uniref:tRNA-splicing endonuclease subunit Sen54 N-terminal domain-containing protein n=1 Tax=Jimgerdemannia flammicorona TaxID=994334 RepID=A0A433QHD7_9FUNG|nr:hypothetical protein BC938DRAFT_480918 [Jimgerdemannia flammicorona]
MLSSSISLNISQQPLSISPNSKSPPRRGTKDFLPDGSDRQASLIQESRDALITLIKEERKASQKSVCEGVHSLWTGLTRVNVIRGNHLHNMGHTVAGKPSLYPEEALFLVSRGVLAVVPEEKEEEEMAETERKPMTAQQAWHRMVGAEDGDGKKVVFEKYQVGWTMDIHLLIIPDLASHCQCAPHINPPHLLGLRLSKTPWLHRSQIPTPHIDDPSSLFHTGSPPYQDSSSNPPPQSPPLAFHTAPPPPHALALDPMGPASARPTWPIP